MGDDCDDDGSAVSCCDARFVPGGTFLMGRCGDAGEACGDAYDGATDELPEHNAEVAGFYLDTFEVTVGRFRKFVEQFDGTPPPPGAGAHPLIAGSGWQNSWNDLLAADQAALLTDVECYGAGARTWTPSAGANEQYAINCITWYEMFAFCVWDGGRLPTEAEWEFAAAGGTENRLYPWGSASPTGPPVRANFGWTGNTPFIEVGSYPDGSGLFGHHDLSGGMTEMVLDAYDAAWYSGTGNTCINCANLADISNRTRRSGAWNYHPTHVRAAFRDPWDALDNWTEIGFRCARNR
jgi:formylglycine-generating enzyme required for sulfatase activity